MLYLSHLLGILNKFPDILLKYINSRSKYKSKELSVAFKWYLKTFKIGLVKLLKLEKYPEQEKLFLDFIILGFPKEKIKNILKNLKTEGKISQKDHDKRIYQLIIRKKASK